MKRKPYQTPEVKPLSKQEAEKRMQGGKPKKPASSPPRN
jgi:hypothetical protein